MTLRSKSRKRRAKGEGYIRFDEKNQRWIGSFQPETGKRKYVSGKRGESQKDFLKRFDEAKRNGAGEAPKAAEHTFRSFVEEYWLPSIAPPQVRPRTYDSYEATVNTYLLPIFGDVPLSKVTKEHVKAAMTEARRLGRSTRTVNYVRSIARIVLGVAVADELLDRNVAANTKPEKGESRFLVEPVPTADIPAIEEAARSVNNGLLVVVAVLLGLRRGELCGLQWEDYDPKARTIAVRRQVLRYRKRLHVDPLKTAKSRRIVGVPPSLAEELEAHRRRQLERQLKAGDRWRDEGFIFAARFGGPLDPRNAHRIFVGVLNKAGVQLCRLHDLRHTAATIQYESGTSEKMVSEMLGHTSVRITSDIYAHVTPVMMDEAVERMERVLKGKK
jgi:integrase